MNPSLKEYYQVFCKSQEALNLLNVTDFPLDLTKICDELGILLFTKNEYLEYRKATKQTSPLIPIADGRSYLTYRNGQKVYTIIYDDKPYWRWRFTIAHELGHILLGHLNDSRLEIDRGGIDNDLYYEFENQADVFAGNFLAPPILIHEKLKSYSFPFVESTICNTFHISNASTKYYRMKDYKLWQEMNPIEDELHLLERCQKSMHYHRCNNCKSVSYVPNVLYCEVCGAQNNFNRFRGGEEMIYSKIELDKNNKPHMCPTCKNEILFDFGEYCQICGTPIYNNCEDALYNELNSSCNGYKLTGDARYCPYCGSKTTYLTSGLLKPYKDELEEIVEEKDTLGNQN